MYARIADMHQESGPTGLPANAAGGQPDSRTGVGTADGGADTGGTARPSPPVVAAGGALLATAVILAALNLRSAITSVGPLLGDMRADLGASSVWAGVLTTLPVWCFAVAGFAAPMLATRIGLGRSIAVALGLLAVGLIVRVLGGAAVVIGGTLVAASGIALANVLIPVVIKSSFPAKLGLMTGAYTAALQLSGALGAALSPPLERGLGGWRQSLASWAGLAVLALLVVILAVRRMPRGRRRSAGTGRGRSMLRSPLAWVVTVFFGFQSFLAYIAMGWLPEVFIDSGVSKTDAGLLGGLLSLIAVPISLVLAPLAARRSQQSDIIVALGVLGLAGVIGLLVDPGAAPLLWSLLFGLGLSVFTLSLTVIALRARTAEDTAKLSGMAQGIGYFIAGFGPFLFGFLHDLTGGWTAAWVMVLVVYIAQICFGAVAGRRAYV